MHIYASNMHLICRNMHLICINMQQICTKYAKNMQKICHYIDFNIANMQFICKKYAKNMLNMQQKYAKNMQKICRICISLCICIFCIYMHSPLCWCSASNFNMTQWLRLGVTRDSDARPGSELCDQAARPVHYFASCPLFLEHWQRLTDSLSRADGGVLNNWSLLTRHLYPISRTLLVRDQDYFCHLNYFNLQCNMIKWTMNRQTRF